MRNYTPSELYHLQENVSYGVDPGLLGRSRISLADPSLFNPWRKHGGGGTSGNGGGDTSGNGDEYEDDFSDDEAEDEGWWAGLSPWIKVTGGVVGVSSLIVGAYKLSGR